MVLVRLFNEKATILQRQGKLHSFLNCVGRRRRSLGALSPWRTGTGFFPPIASTRFLSCVVSGL